MYKITIILHPPQIYIYHHIVNKKRDKIKYCRTGERELDELRSSNHHLLERLETLSRSRSSSPSLRWGDTLPLKISKTANKMHLFSKLLDPWPLQTKLRIFQNNCWETERMLGVFRRKLSAQNFILWRKHKIFYLLSSFIIERLLNQDPAMTHLLSYTNTVLWCSSCKINQYVAVPK